jgi:hypothetical protein
MTVQKVTYSRMLNVYPSAFCNIPTPFSFIVSGASTAIIADSLRDTATNFIERGVKVGDIVYNDTSRTGATVLSILDANTLELNNDIFTNVADEYSIYGGYQNTLSNQGCILYTPQGGNTISFVTVGGDEIASQTYVDALIPIQAIKLLASTSAEIYALW